MMFHDLFMQLKKLSMYEYVSHRVEGIYTLIVLKSLQDDHEFSFSLANSEARLFLSVFGLVKNFVENKEVDV